MNKVCLVLMVFLLVIPISLASFTPIIGDNETMITTYGGYDQFYGSYQFGDNQTGVFYYGDTAYNQPIQPPGGSGAGGGAGMSKNATCLNYICEVNEDIVCPVPDLFTDCNGVCDYDPTDPFSDQIGSPDCPTQANVTAPPTEETPAPPKGISTSLLLVIMFLAFAVLLFLIVYLISNRRKRRYDDE